VENRKMSPTVKIFVGGAKSSKLPATQPQVIQKFPEATEEKDAAGMVLRPLSVSEDYSGFLDGDNVAEFSRI
jgi:hypothetical protein